MSATTYIFVTDPLPALLSLGIGGAMDAKGMSLDTDAEFQGGSSIDGKAFSKKVTYQIDNDSSIFVKGIIQVDNKHLNQEADIIVVASIFNLDLEIFCMLNELTICEKWDGKPKSLEAFKNNITLPKELSITFSIPLWAGNFMEPNTILGYFGYRLNNGTIVFNQQPIEITVINSNLTSDNN